MASVSYSRGGRRLRKVGDCWVPSPLRSKSSLLFDPPALAMLSCRLR